MAQRIKDFAISAVATAPSPATSGTSLVVTGSTGSRFPKHAPFYLTLVPSGSKPTIANSEVVLVTVVSTDTFTITRAQKGTAAKSVSAGWDVFLGIYAEDIRKYSTHMKDFCPMPDISYFNGLHTGGADWYAGPGTLSHPSTTPILGTAYQRVVTTGNGASDGYEYDLAAPLDWSNHRHGIWIRCDNWAKLAEITIIVSTLNFFDEYYQVNLAAGISSPENNEWLLVYIDRHNWAIGAGTPDWATSNKFIIRVNDNNTGTGVTVDAAGFHAFPAGPTGYVTIEFDDGWETAYTNGIKGVLDRYGLKTTQNIIPEALGTTDYMTQAMVDDMHTTGHEIGGHGATSLVDVVIADGIDEVDNYLSYVRNWLHEHGYRGQDQFTYPNGNSKDNIRAVTSKYFGNARALGVVGQPTSAVQPMKLSSRTVSGITDTPAEINAEIDAAITNKDWLILCFHKIIPSGTPAFDTEYVLADFDTIVAHISASGYKCLPRGEVLRRIR